MIDEKKGICRRKRSSIKNGDKKSAIKENTKVFPAAQKTFHTKTAVNTILYNSLEKLYVVWRICLL